MIITMLTLTSCNTKIPTVKEAMSKSSEYMLDISSFDVDIDWEINTVSNITIGDNTSSNLNIKYNGKMLGAKDIINFTGTTTVEFLGYQKSQEANYYMIQNNDIVTNYAKNDDVWIKTTSENSSFKFDNVKNLINNTDLDILEKISTIKESGNEFIITADFKKLSKEDAKKIFNIVDTASSSDAIINTDNFTENDLATFEKFTVEFRIDNKSFKPNKVIINVDGKIPDENNEKEIYLKANIILNDFNKNDDLMIPDEVIQNAVIPTEESNDQNMSYETEESVYDIPTATDAKEN